MFTDTGAQVYTKKFMKEAFVVNYAYGILRFRTSSVFLLFTRENRLAMIFGLT